MVANYGEKSTGTHDSSCLSSCLPVYIPIYLANRSNAWDHEGDVESSIGVALVDPLCR